jgi:FMN phosphatase YigB (HAD superfamily)
VQIIIDFDGTLTAEETQVDALAALSLDTLASDILGVPRARLAAEYAATRARLLATPHRGGWMVNGLRASYCNEGAFILNTTTLQALLRETPAYARAVAAAYPHAAYDPVVDCTNALFHRHTASLGPAFRPHAAGTLNALLRRPGCRPVVLTNSLGDKVRRLLTALPLEGEVPVLGDTRQYDMDPAWPQTFPHPALGAVQVWPVSQRYRIDLRRPAYHRALVAAAQVDPRIVVVADTFSLPGALPLMMGLPFILLRTPYTPRWCARAVRAHPLGRVLERMGDLPEVLDDLVGAKKPGPSSRA